ncbi:Alpha/Beta hydrolase protein [Abortiporus biennis]|nr:Alpha/Beta hydrolase protein [Abortiporus biennis]
MAQYTHLATPSAEIIAALSRLPSPIDTNDPEAFKAGFLAGLDSSNAIRKTFMTCPPDDELQVTERIIPVDGGEISVLTYVPTPRDHVKDIFPLFLWIHGGGWSFTILKLDDFMLRRICFELKISIVSVAHRVAPEFPFPVPVNDCYEALKWTVSNDSDLSASPAKGLIIGGCSSGGNIAAALALRARDDPFFNKEGGKAITGQLLQVPAVIHPDVVPTKYKPQLLSYEQCKDAPVLPAKNMYTFLKFYKPDPYSPLFSPLLASSHEGLAPAYLQISGMDPLRDECFLYEKILSESGVITKLDVYPGYIHGGNYTLPGLDITKKYEQDFVEGVRWLLQLNGHEGTSTSSG